MILDFRFSILDCRRMTPRAESRIQNPESKMGLLEE